MGNLRKIIVLLVLATVCTGVPGMAAAKDVGPGEQPAGDQVRAVGERYAKLDEHFASSMQGYRSRHFVILHDSDDHEVHARADLLERVHGVFRESFEELGVELRPLEDRMVAMLFASERPFLRYAQQADGRDLSWASGYYSARTNRVALIEGDGPLPWRGRAPAEALLCEDCPDHAEHEHGIAEGESVQELASTTHEAAHQLAFNKGVQRRGVAYPFWFAEGLAVSFEVHEPGAAFGPGVANLPRERDLAMALEAGRLTPFRRFVSMAGPRRGDARQLAVDYAQAWSVFTHLHEAYPQELREYIGLMKQQVPGPPSPRVLRNTFEQAFGDVEAVERSWRAWVDEVVEQD